MKNYILWLAFQRAKITWKRTNFHFRCRSHPLDSLRIQQTKALWPDWPIYTSGVFFGPSCNWALIGNNGASTPRASSSSTPSSNSRTPGRVSGQSLELEDFGRYSGCKSSSSRAATPCPASLFNHAPLDRVCPWPNSWQEVGCTQNISRST